MSLAWSLALFPNPLLNLLPAKAQQLTYPDNRKPRLLSSCMVANPCSGDLKTPGQIFHSKQSIWVVPFTHQVETDAGCRLWTWIHAASNLFVNRVSLTPDRINPALIIRLGGRHEWDTPRNVRQALGKDSQL